MLIGLITASVVLLADDGGLGKYSLILDKELFGGEPKAVPTPAPQPTPSPQTPSWARNYRMTMMTYDDYSEQVRVGIQNTQDNSSVLLIQGEDLHKFYKLLSADFDQRSAKISYQGVPHTFRLQQGPAPSTTSSETPRSTRDRGRGGSSSRNRGREIARTPAPTPTPNATPRFQNREELQAHLKRQQMDAIRTGKPPLPIPLTKEMDDQLVKEGVLPPQN